MARHGSRPLNRNDNDMIRTFVEGAPTYPTVLMKAPLRDLKTFSGWWHGAMLDGRLEALMCVEGTAANLYGLNTAAVSAMAEQIFSVQLRRPKGGKATHQLIGEEKSVTPFWNVLKNLNRTLVSDRRRHLLATKEPAAPPKDTVKVAPAKDADYKLVYEYSADHTVEAWGWDPRKMGRESHERRCRAVIESGKLLVGRDRGKPVFLAEMVELETGTIMLDRIFMPRPLRLRKRYASALLTAARYALPEGGEVLLFAEAEDEMTEKALELTNFEVKSTYRLVVSRT